MSPADRATIVARLRAAGCVYAEDEADLLLAAAGTPDELQSMVDSRIGGLPLEHILGWVRFCGIRVSLSPGVFVPRPRTELLVRHAVVLAARDRARDCVVVDLCCGSGAIGAAIAASAGPMRLYAADIDPVCVACARRNLEPMGGRVYQGDLFTPLPADLRGEVDVLVANVPYVPTDELSLLPPEARLHEPRLALDGGGDGLDVLRRVAAEAPGWLVAGGHLLVETSERQAPTAAAILRRAGLTPRVVRDDEIYATVVIGSRQCRVPEVFDGWF
jgi:release factor glutamine methyltransferase